MLGWTGSPPDARYSIVLAHGVPGEGYSFDSVDDSIVEGDKGGRDIDVSSPRHPSLHRTHITLTSRRCYGGTRERGSESE